MVTTQVLNGAGGISTSFSSGGSLSTSISGGGGTTINIGGGSSGTNNYNQLINKPSINGIELKGDLTLEQLGIKDVDFSKLFVRCETKYAFPNIGETNKIYIDVSTGDLFMYGINGTGLYTSIGVANTDVIDGGGANDWLKV